MLESHSRNVRKFQHWEMSNISTSGAERGENTSALSNDKNLALWSRFSHSMGDHDQVQQKSFELSRHEIIHSLRNTSNIPPGNKTNILPSPALNRTILLTWVTAVRINTSLIASFMWPKLGPSGADRTQVGPMLAPWTLLPRNACEHLETTRATNVWSYTYILLQFYHLWIDYADDKY